MDFTADGQEMHQQMKHHKQSILPTSHLNKQQKQEVIEYFLAEHHLTLQKGQKNKHPNEAASAVNCTKTTTTEG